MSIFKRISTTFMARLDHIVSDMENHDAVVAATIKELYKKIATARVRAEQIGREVKQLQTQLAQQQTSAQLWRRRAIESAHQDEAKALQYLARAHVCEQQLEHIQQSLNQYQQTADKLDHDITQAQQHARDSKQKHSLMRARLSASDAMQTAQASDTQSITQLADTFERWEIKLRQAELSLDITPMNDGLEEQFLQQEQTKELNKCSEFLST